MKRSFFLSVVLVPAFFLASCCGTASTEDGSCPKAAECPHTTEADSCPKVVECPHATQTECCSAAADTEKGVAAVDTTNN